MKKTLWILICTISCSFCYSQTDSAKSKTSKKIRSLDEIYIFTIMLTNDSLSVLYNHLMLPISNTRLLDDYLNENQIDKNRVQFVTFHKVGLDSLRAVKNILAKHKIVDYFKVMIE